jgi:hypothetical protein
LGVTGLSPVTVNAGPASMGGAGAVGAAEAVGVAEAVGLAEAVRVAEAVGVAEAVVVIGAGPVGVGVAEHATDSAATAHRAATATAMRAMPAI